MGDPFNDPLHMDWRYSGSDLRKAKDARDAALAEVARLREALEGLRDIAKELADALVNHRADMHLQDDRPCGTCDKSANALASYEAFLAALAEGSDVPGVVPACAGRSNTAHERTQMTPAPSGWRCPACGEVDDAR